MGWTGKQFLVVAVAGLSAMVASAAQTNYYYVNIANAAPSSPYTNWTDAATNIQLAVNEAQSDLGTGTNCIVLVTNGNYTLTNQVEISAAITVRSVNGRGVTFVNGNYPNTTNRCFYITANATLDGFTVTNGFAYGEQPTNYGGGIYAYACTAIVQNCTIMYNRSDRLSAGGQGGGMAVIDGATLVANCLIACNSTVDTGSGVQNGTGIYILNSSGMMRDCVISNNVQAGNNGIGAGIYMRDSPNGVVSNCIAIENVCSRFGGNYVRTGLFTHCLFTNNRARSAGGGVQLYASATGSRLYYSTVVDNECWAGGGGGVAINRGTIHNTKIIYNTALTLGGGVNNGEGYLKNCLIAGNYAGTSGGGMYRYNKGQDTRNCTIVRNSAGTSGGGLYSEVTNRPSHFLNNIIYDNQANSTNNDIASNIANWQDNFTASCSPDLSDGVNSNIVADPIFFDAGSGYGTNAVFGDFILYEGSPCDDAGANEAWMTTTLTNDIALYARILPAGGQVNMGAYEFVQPAPPSGVVIVIR